MENAVPSAASRTQDPTDPPRRNEEIDWDGFDPDVYLNNNYLLVHDPDRAIMAIVRDFFADAGVDPTAHAVDVGAGTNLYPMLAMLPFCARLDLVEFATPNVEWLECQIPGFASNWDDFWKIYAERDEYVRLDPRAEVAKKVRVEQGSVFDLPPRRWDLGTMFFVACSLSAYEEQFRAALHRFLGALRHGAPFAVAFMVNSEGYQVGDRKFPAVKVDTEKVARALASVAYDVRITPIPLDPGLREGYEGMIVATGKVADQG